MHKHIVKATCALVCVCVCPTAAPCSCQPRGWWVSRISARRRAASEQGAIWGGGLPACLAAWLPACLPACMVLQWNSIQEGWPGRWIVYMSKRHGLRPREQSLTWDLNNLSAALCVHKAWQPPPRNCWVPPVHKHLCLFWPKRQFISKSDSRSD